VSKKKLAFYDAFKQKNSETSDSIVDPTTTTNIAGHTSFTPGEDLKLRPQPKHMPTARHNTNLNPTEIRAKGSSIPRGVAEKWQIPNVNKDYIKNDSDILSKKNYRNPDNVSDESQDINSHQESAVSSAPNIKPISFQSETLPYLDSNDLETKSIQIKSSSGDTSFNKLNDLQGQIVLSPAHGLSLLAIFVVSICLSFYFGTLLNSENGQGSVDSSNLRLTNNGVDQAREGISSRRNTTDKAISSRNITSKTSGVISVKKQPSKSKTVDNSPYLYTIRAITVPNGSRVQKIKDKLEEDGFKPVVSRKTRRGYLISVGAFKTKKEADKVLKRLVKKVINHSRPFSSAYRVNK